MKIYTKTGDDGTTSLFGGSRVPKHHIRIESYGTLDELNSWLGLVRDQDIDGHTRDVLIAIQEKLFTIGAILATDPDKAILKSGKKRLTINRIEEADLTFLENEMDQMQGLLPPMNHFVLPGGHTTVSYCHISRTVCRRAERMATLLNSEEPVDSYVLAFINRLSDYLFVLARKLSYDSGASEIKWIPAKND
jgi:cob(I)alamin adenosyltransferase